MTPDNRLCAFQYDKDWLANGFSISPLDLPLKPELFIAQPEPFWGNFGSFRRQPSGWIWTLFIKSFAKKTGRKRQRTNPSTAVKHRRNIGYGSFMLYPRNVYGRKQRHFPS